MFGESRKRNKYYYKLLAVEFKISKIYAKKTDLRYTQKQREHPEIHQQH